LDYLQKIAGLRQKGASDLHLEPGLLPTARIHGSLKPVGSEPLEPQQTLAIVKELLSEKEWAFFRQRQSSDLSLVLSGIRCRVHVMQTKRGVGLAIRLLSSFQPTLERLNLHPDLATLMESRHGLIVVCGPTGSGKSSTIAGLLHEVSSKESLHIVTIEQPVEYPLAPRRSFVRQREVGQDTPSFEQALLDAMREDPDLIMVGEMRTRETVQLTLNAAETGQLVLSTLHASNTGEAVQRIVSSFPPEVQSSVCAQLADCLVAVVAQRLQFNENYQIRVPLCEILKATHPVRNQIRQGQFFKLPSALETGHGEGCWTKRRYQKWLESRTDFFIPTTATEPLETMPRIDEIPVEGSVSRASKHQDPIEKDRLPESPAPGNDSADDVIVIDEPSEESLSDILKKLDDSPPS
jgi:twitching motility protein PilT